MLRVLHDQRFRQFELQRAARHRGARQHGADVVNQIVPQQLPRGDVDAGADRFARTHRALPDRELPRGLVHHEHAEIDTPPATPTNAQWKACMSAYYACDQAFTQAIHAIRWPPEMKADVDAFI